MQIVTDHKYIAQDCHEKGCQELVLKAELARGRNYVADHEVFPTEVTFANGRSVRIVRSGEKHYLEIC
jgi:hypothetical protein